MIGRENEGLGPHSENTPENASVEDSEVAVKVAEYFSLDTMGQVLQPAMGTPPMVGVNELPAVPAGP